MSNEIKDAWLSVPWTLELVQDRPFGVVIMAGDREILSQHACCYSTKQKTREDNEMGVGFENRQDSGFTSVAEAQQYVAEQDAIARLISAAPDMLKALKYWQEYDRGYSGTWSEAMTLVESAIAKAEGKA